MKKTAFKRKAKGSAKQPRAKVIKPAKPTLEQLSDTDRERLLMGHKKKIIPLLAAKNQAVADLKKAYDIAKEEGVPKKHIDFAIKLGKEEGIKATNAEIKWQNLVIRWMGVGKQLELFGTERITDSQRLYEDGKRAAFSEAMRQAPSYVHASDTKHWYEGYDAGLAHVKAAWAAKDDGGGFKSLGDVVRESVVPDAAPPPPEDAPAPNPTATSH